MSINQNFPEIRPSLNLNFARSKTLDPRITFTRASTATYVDEDGLIKTAVADEARFDHDPETGESLGLLIEESRTNLFTYSENLTSGAGWSNVSQSNMTATNVSEENPGGGSTTTQITGGSLNSWWAKNFTASVSTTYQISLWVKVADGGADFNVGIRFYAPGATSGAIIYGTGFNVTSSWKRVTGYVTSSANFSGSFSRLIVLQLDNTRSFYAWGIQVEAGSFPTSYIPTTSSTVTRSPDIASIEGTNFSSWYNQSEGTVFAEATGEGARVVGINDGTGSYRHEIFLSPSNTFCYQVRANINEVNIFKPKESKSSFAYKTNDYSYTAGGSSVVTDTSATPPTVDQMSIGCWYNDTSQLNGHISRLTYYPERLTNAQLQTLTK